MLADQFSSLDMSRAVSEPFLEGGGLNSSAARLHAAKPI
jgi:hypothetical protein